MVSNRKVTKNWRWSFDHSLYLDLKMVGLIGVWQL